MLANEGVCLRPQQLGCTATAHSSTPTILERRGASRNFYSIRYGMAKQSNYWYVRLQTEIRTKPTADVALSAENVVIFGRGCRIF